MYIGKVIGSVTISQGEPGLKGKKLIIIKYLDADGNETGKYNIAVDKMGAGFHETVLLVKGKEGVDMLTGYKPPADLTICGIIDLINHPKEEK
ncbi:EutN/CcmL family microcompartment protein [bacterium]|nr:EutN/CcmL family microcompartment protein [bacterium]